MKSLNTYLTEKLVIFPSQVNEKLVINKNYKDYKNAIDKIADEIYNNAAMKDCIKQVDDSFDSQKELIDILAEASMVQCASRWDIKKYVKKHIAKWWRNNKLFDGADKCIEYLSWNHCATVINTTVYKLSSEIGDNAGDTIEYNELNFPGVGIYNMMVEAYQSEEYVTFIVTNSKSERFILLGILICKL